MLDEYLKQKPVSFPVLVDKDNALAQKFKIESFPTTVLIGADGKIRQVEEGVVPYLEFFRARGAGNIPSANESAARDYYRDRRLTKIFRTRFRRREVKAVVDLSLRVARGSVVAFVGPNGAGKTTTIFMLLGLLHPTVGSVRLFGLPAGSLEVRGASDFQSEIFYTYGFKRRNTPAILRGAFGNA